MVMSDVTGRMRAWPLVRHLPKRSTRHLIEQLIVVPADPRTPDPSFADELADGVMGLAGAVLNFGCRSVFELAPPTEAFARELHGFGWFRHLDAARSEHAEKLARQMILDWIEARPAGIARDPEVTARRVLSWLAHSNVALQGAALSDFDAIMDALSAEIEALTEDVKRSTSCRARLTGCIALTEAAICTGRTEAEVGLAQNQLADELAAQFNRDGGHVSRNPGVGADILLDLLPLQQLYAQRRELPVFLNDTIARATALLERLRLGDGTLPRFNGMGASPMDSLATLLGPAIMQERGSHQFSEAGYLRLDAGKSVILLDAGQPPPPRWSQTAHAGALSFEMSCGRAMLFANCGTSHSLTPVEAGMARATSSHSALVLGQTSSLLLMPRQGDAEGLLQSLPTGAVGAKLETDDGRQHAMAWHDGYKSRFGVTHHRCLTLAADGRKLDGVDHLEASGNPNSTDTLPIEIRFHLHPSVRVDRDAVGCVRLTAANGMRWSFAVESGEISIEPAPFFAGTSRTRPTLQLVVHTSYPETTEIRWSVMTTA
jgi:uncharacterized heparinase superfamily protein